MKKGKLLVAVGLAAAAVLVAGVAGMAGTASAFPGVSYPDPCDGCHSGAGTAPTVTLLSSTSTTSTYSLSGGGLEWAVFDGSTRIAGIPGDTGQFSLANNGDTYTVFSVQGFPGPLGVATVTPSAPTTTTTFTITPTAGANGSITPSSALDVASGSDATFTITPDTGFQVSDVLVDGVSVGATTTYTFTDVTADHTISATFAPVAVTTYTITPTAGDNGSIFPSTPQTVASGQDFTFTIMPDTGFQVSDVLVDGVSVGATTTYTFTDVTADHTISATFAPVAVTTYTITPTAGANGSIFPSTPQTVASGQDFTFTIMPDTGFQVSDVLVDGVSVGATTTYTFTDVTADHTISATFSSVTTQTATHISLRASTPRGRHGRDDVRLSSHVRNDAGLPFTSGQVLYQMEAPGSSQWTDIETVAVDADGHSSIRVELAAGWGTYRFRAMFLGTDVFLPSTSRVVRVHVRRFRGRHGDEHFGESTPSQPASSTVSSDSVDPAPAGPGTGNGSGAGWSHGNGRHDGGSSGSGGSGDPGGRHTGSHDHHGRGH